MEKNINFLAWLYPMSKGFYGQRSRARHAKAVPGAGRRVGGQPPQPPPPHCTPASTLPQAGTPPDSPPPGKGREPLRQGRGLGAKAGGGGGGGGFPSSGLILLGSSTAQRWLGPGMERGQAACVVSPPLYCGGGFSTKPSWFWPGKGEGRSLHPPPGTQLSIPPASVLERPHSFPTDGHGGPRGRGQAGISGWS